MNHLKSHSPLRDEDYVRLIRGGGKASEKVVRQLYLQYRKTVRDYFTRLTEKYISFNGHPDDLLHDAFIILIRKVEFESQPIHSLCAYWKTIGRGLLLNQLKKDDRILLAHDVEEVYGLDEESPESLYIRKEREEWLARAFELLGARCRDILLLWASRFTMPEIATAMHLSGEAMARKIKYHCFKKLRELVRTGNKMPNS